MTAEAPLAPAPVAPPQVAPVETPTLPVEDVQKKVAEAEQLGAQPDKPEQQPLAAQVPDAQPVHAQPAGQNGELKEPPKPASMEEVQDPELPVSKPLETKEVPKPEIGKEAPVEAPTASSAIPAKDVDMPTAAQTEESAPKVDPAPTATEPEIAAPPAEPQVGDKRAVDDVSGTNGEESSEVVPEPDVPSEKKQKTNGGAANGATKKAGRPKKEKKPAVPVGRTLRKTRSQGNVDAL